MHGICRRLRITLLQVIYKNICINNAVGEEQIYYCASMDPPLPPDNDISLRANEIGQISNSL